jgi:hypothetical protein
MARNRCARSRADRWLGHARGAVISSRGRRRRAARPRGARARRGCRAARRPTLSSISRHDPTGAGRVHCPRPFWSMQLITYAGEGVALVVNGDLVVFAPDVEARGRDDPLFRFVAAICRLAMELELGIADGPYDEERAHALGAQGSSAIPLRALRSEVSEPLRAAELGLGVRPGRRSRWLKPRSARARARTPPRRRACRRSRRCPRA